jgi:hypothetical protein
MFIEDLSEKQIAEFTKVYGAEFMEYSSDYRFQDPATEKKIRCRFNFDYEQWNVFVWNELKGFIDYCDSVDEFKLEQLAMELSDIENRFYN